MTGVQTCALPIYEEANKVLTEFIEKQREYTKNVVDAGCIAASGILSIITSSKFHKECTDIFWCKK